MMRYGRNGAVLVALWTVLALPLDPPPLAAADVGASAPPPQAAAPFKTPAPADGAAASPVKPQPVSPASGTAAVVLDLTRVGGLVGRGVKSRHGDGMGHIVDVLVSPSGTALAAVIDFGGILGVGSRKVAVDWKALSFEKVAADGFVGIDLTRDELRIAPEYKAGEPVVVLQSAATAAPTKAPAPPPGEVERSEAKPIDAKPAADGQARETTDTAAKRASEGPAAVKSP